MMKKETKGTIEALILYTLLISGVIVGCAIPIIHMISVLSE